MQMSMKTVAIAIATTLAGGCASGGGGSGGGDDFGTVLVCMMAPWTCSYAAGQSSTAGTSTLAAEPPHAAFRTWTDLQRNTRTDAPALTTSTMLTNTNNRTVQVYDRRIGEGGVTVQYDQSNRPYEFSGSPYGWSLSGWSRLSVIGQSGIDLTPVDKTYPSTSAFSDIAHSMFAVVANPYALGWNYQSFGAWDVQWQGSGFDDIGAASFGSATPDSSVPTGGTATFAGKLGGLYVGADGKGAIAAADLSVGVDFGARSLTFASTGTRLTRDLVTGPAASSLDLSGTLTYSPGSNTFSGTLSNSGGTMSGDSQGKFYGPAAQELGGVFTLKSATGVERFTGAYGAKR